MNQLASKIIADAIAAIGVREIGFSNTGLEVNKYLRFVGLTPGQPWCAAFVCYRIYQAAHEVGFNITKWTKSGSAEMLYLNAKRHGLIHASPEPGDVFFEWFPGLNRYAHTGFVKAVNGSSFVSIEGNSNTDGSREGYEVCSITRRVTPGKYMFARVL